jgi:hypothetical protein
MVTGGEGGAAVGPLADACVRPELRAASSRASSVVPLWTRDGAHGTSLGGPFYRTAADSTVGGESKVRKLLPARRSELRVSDFLTVGLGFEFLFFEFFWI